MIDDIQVKLDSPYSENLINRSFSSFNSLFSHLISERQNEGDFITTEKNNYTRTPFTTKPIAD